MRTFLPTWLHIRRFALCLAMASLPALTASGIGPNSHYLNDQGMGDDEDSCFSEGPLIQRRWKSVSLPGNEGLSLGEWRLPLNPSQKDIITEARMQVLLSRPMTGGPWQALISFRFPDPKPFGIPFTFQKVALFWGDSQVERDWSDACSSTGPSIFPGQSYSEVVELTGTDGLLFLDKFEVRLWGSRN